MGDVRSFLSAGNNPEDEDTIKVSGRFLNRGARLSGFFLL
jgi:hypothetical protein